MKTRYYIALTLYNYDLTSRYDRRKIYFDDETTARKEYADVQRRFTQVSWLDIQKFTGKWVKKHGFEDAWVNSIEGLFKETTEKLSDGE